MTKQTSTSKTARRKKTKLPQGWNEKRVRKVIDYYENQTEDEALAEYQGGMQLKGLSLMFVPTDLVHEVRRLIAQRRGA